MNTKTEDPIVIDMARVVELTHILEDLFQEYSGGEIGAAIVAALGRNAVLEAT